MRRLQLVAVILFALLLAPGCATLRAVAEVSDNVCELIAPASVCAVLAAALGTFDEARASIEGMRKSDDQSDDQDGDNPPITGATPDTTRGPVGGGA